MQFPAPVRAVVGLLASAADEAKHLPDRALELPMLAVSTALQVSMRAQQRYAQLAARGDEVLNRRPASDEPPPWATFDEPAAGGTLRVEPGGAEPGGDEPERFEPDDDEPPAGAAAPAGATAPADAGEPLPGAAAAPADATSGATVATPGARAAGARARRAPARRAADSGRGKAVSKPRHTAPSRFDDAADE
jgi:hypothetical protein